MLPAEKVRSAVPAEPEYVNTYLLLSRAASPLLSQVVSKVTLVGVALAMLSVEFVFALYD